MATAPSTTRRTFVRAFPFIGAAAAIAVGDLSTVVSAVADDPHAARDRALLSYLKTAPAASRAFYHARELAN